MDPLPPFFYVRILHFVNFTHATRGVLKFINMDLHSIPLAILSNYSHERLVLQKGDDRHKLRKQHFFNFGVPVLLPHGPALFIAAYIEASLCPLPT